MPLRPIHALCFAAALAACAPTNGRAPLTADTACADYAHARCVRLAGCAPYDLETTYGDLSNCEARVKISCLASASAPGTTATPEFWSGCAAAVPSQSCNDPFTPSACVAPSGPGANGTPCFGGAQCASGYCQVARGAMCGACQDPPPAGTSCEVYGCGRDTFCLGLAPTRVCGSYAEYGAPCDKSAPCSPGLSCVGAAAAAPGYCQLLATSVGASCDAHLLTGPACDRRLGLYCAASKTCASYTFAGIGQGCGTVGDGGAAACTGPATCFKEPDGGSRTCRPTTDDQGGHCDPDEGDSCASPARCLHALDGGPSGTCALPDPMGCR